MIVNTKSYILKKYFFSIAITEFLFTNYIHIKYDRQVINVKQQCRFCGRGNRKAIRYAALSDVFLAAYTAKN